MSIPVQPLRYSFVAQALHWLTAPFVLVVLVLAWIAEALPKGADKGFVFTLHKSVGITILLLIVVRLVWRARHPAPPEPGSVGTLLTLVGKVSHWLIYFIFVAMPVSGYLMSANGKPLGYFGWFDLPGIPKSEALGDAAHGLHLAGQWAVYVLVALHVLATAWHAGIRRDGVVDRMIPLQDRAG